MVCAYIFWAQRSNGEALMKKDCILVDTCSTTSVFWNPDLIDNIIYSNAQEILEIVTNVG